jgi:hypothetical protein
MFHHQDFVPGEARNVDAETCYASLAGGLETGVHQHLQKIDVFLYKDDSDIILALDKLQCQLAGARNRHIERAVLFLAVSVRREQGHAPEYFTTLQKMIVKIAQLKNSANRRRVAIVTPVDVNRRMPELYPRLDRVKEILLVGGSDPSTGLIHPHSHAGMVYAWYDAQCASPESPTNSLIEMAHGNGVAGAQVAGLVAYFWSLPEHSQKNLSQMVNFVIEKAWARGADENVKTIWNLYDGLTAEPDTAQRQPPNRPGPAEETNPFPGHVPDSPIPNSPASHLGETNPFVPKSGTNPASPNSPTVRPTRFPATFPIVPFPLPLLRHVSSNQDQRICGVRLLTIPIKSVLDHVPRVPPLMVLRLGLNPQQLLGLNKAHLGNLLLVSLRVLVNPKALVKLFRVLIKYFPVS